MSVNPKLFQTIFNKNPKHYTDDEKMEMIAIMRKAIIRKAVQSAQTRSNDTILFLRGDNVEKVMDMSKINRIYNECFTTKQ